MKIGDLAKNSGLSVSTIRYYVNEGFIIPQKKNTKFYFNNNDLQTLMFIKRLRAHNFSMQEIHQIISLRRVSNWVEPEDLVEYINILSLKKKELEQAVSKLNVQINSLEKEIEEIEQQKLYPTNLTGVPLKCLEYLQCPHCKQPLRLNATQMNYRYIFNSELSCNCGYKAHIKNGILYTEGPNISNYDKPDTERAVYKTMPHELITLFQKTYNWIMPHLMAKQSDSQIIMETHLNSFFFLYKHLKFLREDNLYIISDKFQEIVEMYKTNIERLGLNLNILYIVNNDILYPLKEQCVDIFIDYCSSNEHSIFSDTFLLEDISPYLKKNGVVYSTFFSFNEFSKSIKTLCASYPENNINNYKLNWFKQNVPKNYTITNHKQIGHSENSGDGISFIFHQNGEKIYIDCFELVPKTVDL